MQVGLVVYGNLDRISGGYLYDRRVVQYLRDRGDDVRIFKQPERPYPLGVVDNAHVPFWRRLAAADVDVLLQDELNHPSLCLGTYWLRRQIDAPIVAIVHHLRCCEDRPWLGRTLARTLEHVYLKAVDACVYNSPITRETVESLTGRKPSVIARPSGRRLGKPVSDEWIDQRAQQNGPLRVVFVGNVIPRKQLGVLIDGLVRVNHEHWTLDVVGDLTAEPGYVRRIRRQVAESRVESRVRLHGRLGDAALCEVLRHSHALAVPSAYEGYGIVYVEAMGRGLPVLAGREGGARDVVDHGRTGWFVSGPADVATAVRTWARDRSRLAVMGRAATRYYRSTPTWTDTAATVAAFLDDLAGT